MSQIYVPATSSMPSLPTSFVANTNTAVPAANVLNVLGDPTGVVTTNANPNLGNNLYIYAPPGGTKWQVTTSASFTMASNNSYILGGITTPVDIALPASPNQFDICEIFSFANVLFTITQRTGEQIFMIGSPTTNGATGSLSSASEYNYIKLICMGTSPNNWGVIGSIGNFEAV